MEIIRQDKHWGSGRSKHFVFILGGKEVMLVNYDDYYGGHDDYYSQIFKSPQEINELISVLQRARDEVYGPHSYMAFDNIDEKTRKEIYTGLEEVVRIDGKDTNINLREFRPVGFSSWKRDEVEYKMKDVIYTDDKKCIYDLRTVKTNGSNHNS
jgi:hypothetical protein